jgi:DNA-binding NarL/FixJ family response regulator
MPGLETEVRMSPVSSARASELDGREHGTPPAVLPSVETLERPAGSEPDSVGSSVREQIRVVIADDSASTRRFLRAVLEHCRQFDVAGEATDGDSAVRMCRLLQPDLVLLDLAMPLVHGTSALSGIRMAAPKATVIVVSGMDPALEAPVLEAGATAFVPKGVAPFDFLDRLGSILDRSLGMEYREDWEEISGRAVVFDGDPVTRHLVTQVLDRCGVVVSAETDTASNLLDVVDRSKPDIVVVGLSTAKPNTRVISQVIERSPGSAVVVYSGREALREDALAAGASAFVLHPRIDELVKRIHGLMVVT